MSDDFNFVGIKYTEEDRHLFLDDDVLQPIQEGWIMAHVLHAVGAFDSIGAARKNGWDYPIPNGWNEYKLPKKFHGRKLYIWNPKYSLEEWANGIGQLCWLIAREAVKNEE